LAAGAMRGATAQHAIGWRIVSVRLIYFWTICFWMIYL
jgi:hypothetical protein